MTMTTKTSDAAARARRLREDHGRFSREFDDIYDRARTGDWHELDEAWRAFTEHLEAHLAFEEKEVFPGLREQGPTFHALVQRLTAQHDEIRQTLLTLGLQIQLKEIRASSVEAFIDLMRKHATLEDARVYPWVAREAPADPASPRSERHA